MKASEKKCPACAEVIQLEAKLCKHCGRQFTTDEISAEKEERALRIAARRQKQIDSALKEEACVESISDLGGEEISQSTISEIAESLKIPSTQVELRARDLNMDVFGPPSDQEKAAIRNSLQGRPSIDGAACREIAEHLGVRWVHVYEQAAELSIRYSRHLERESFERAQETPPSLLKWVVGALVAAGAATIIYIMASGPSNVGRQTAAGGSYESNQPAADRADPTAGMSAESQRQYNNLSPDGKRYVQEQMKRYDSYCASSTNC